MPRLTSKGKRSFTYSIIIVFILAVFALGYLFHFIPRNKSTIHKNGFLILQSISANIENAANSRVTLYTNFVKASQGKKEKVDTLIAKNNIDAKLEILSLHNKKDSAIKILLIENDSLTVQIKFSQDKIFRISEAIETFLEPLLSPRKTELFSFYTLLRVDKGGSKLIYHDPELAVLSNEDADSLMPGGTGSFVAGIRDLNSQNIDLKMFYYPFSIRNTPFIVSGFVEAGKYDHLTRQIPFYFICPLVIIFLLLLILFPIIKFYVMDSNEPLRVSDVIFFGVSAILGSSLLTIMIIQLLLWKGEEKRAETNLKNKISAQIKQAFNNELRKAFNEIEFLDNYKITHHGIKEELSDSIRSFLKKTAADSSAYLHFDRISWVDDSGNQKLKAELYSEPVFTNVHDRKYFQVFKTGTPYTLQGNESRQFGWEPLYSWTNGEFNISISIKSGDTIVAMASRMYSLMQTILPEGYGFCIIDQGGNVMVHSDGSRSLRENFLSKTDKPDEIKASMASRQIKVINNVTVYDKLHMIVVEPLDKGMPFFLVSFFDKGHIVPVNMRILIFSLLLCSLFFVSFAVVWWLLSRKGSKAHPLVYCEMDFMDWASPKSKSGTYYLHGFIFTVSYFFSMIAFVIFNRYYNISNSNIVALVIITPFNILLALYCMHSAFVLKNEKWKTILYVLIHLITSFIFYFSAGKIFLIDSGFLFFQLLINAIMWIYGLAKFKIGGWSAKPGFFLIMYRLLITSIVISLSVLPASLFTWYAHNQELTQSVKRQQLYLANKIKERSFLIQDSKQSKDSLLPGSYFDSLKFSYGIYRIYSDRIKYDTCEVGKKQQGTKFEKFYFALAEKPAGLYYNNESFAALEDTAFDKSWYWTIDKESIHFCYRPVIPPGNSQRLEPFKKSLEIISIMPERFVYLTKRNFLPVIIVGLLLIMGLFAWLGRNAEQIFLTRFIFPQKLNKPEKKTGLVEDFFGDKPITLNERIYTPSAYKGYTTPCRKETMLVFEKEIVKDMEGGKEFYDYVWNHCTEKEKFLLYGFARDGILNYKNTTEIIGLMNKQVLIVDENDERLRIFSPAFRAFILFSVDSEQITKLQNEHMRNSSWQYIRMPLMILLIGIAALVFFTQQGIFDKLLLLAGGVSTLLGLGAKFFTGEKKSE